MRVSDLRPGRRRTQGSLKILAQLDWQPAVTFEEGIEKTVRWYLDHPGWLANVLDGSYQEYYEKQYRDRHG